METPGPFQGDLDDVLARMKGTRDPHGAAVVLEGRK